MTSINASLLLPIYNRVHIQAHGTHYMYIFCKSISKLHIHVVANSHRICQITVVLYVGENARQNGHTSAWFGLLIINLRNIGHCDGVRRDENEVPNRFRLLITPTRIAIRPDWKHKRHWWNNMTFFKEGRVLYIKTVWLRVHIIFFVLGHFILTFINTLWHNGDIWRHGSVSPLFQLTACRVFDTNPWPQSVLTSHE